ncbi:MAG TPA: hypothetical protein VF246_01215 [Acidimicrobiia bacterium]
MILIAGGTLGCIIGFLMLAFAFAAMQWLEQFSSEPVRLGRDEVLFVFCGFGMIGGSVWAARRPSRASFSALAVVIVTIILVALEVL